MKPYTKNITHSCQLSDNEKLREVYVDKIRSRENLIDSTEDEQIFIVDEMLRSDLGKFILENKGTNGFWTDVLITCTPENEIGKRAKNNFFEDFLLFRSPVVLAHRERFKLFQKSIQSFLKPGLSLASLPCGLMRDLLTLDYSGAPGCKLTGIDIDKESLKLASDLSKSLKCTNELQLFQQNAWEIKISNKFDVITSSGLNVYEPSRERTVELYKLLLKALKPGGLLVTSVLTYPPSADGHFDWDLSSIPAEDLRLERIIHHDILGVKWGNFRSVDDLKTDFYSAGYSRVEVLMDSKKIFPTILAYK